MCQVQHLYVTVYYKYSAVYLLEPIRYMYYISEFHILLTHFVRIIVLFKENLLQFC